MATIEEAAQEFLAQKRIAVAGVSRQPSGHGANTVYRRLRERGYEVFAVNPHADTVEGDPCYHDLGSIPGGVDAVVIGTTPAVAESVVRECHELGITRVWMHRGVGPGSVSDAAADYCRRNGGDPSPRLLALVDKIGVDVTYYTLLQALESAGVH
jgi:predicted CoA-binding protein